MATFTWTKAGTDLWSTASNWTPTGGPPGVIPANADVANLISSATGVGSFTVLAGFGAFPLLTLSTLNISSEDSGHAVDLEVLPTGTLITNTLALADGAKGDDHLTIGNGGIFNIVTTINSAKAETINIGGTGDFAEGGGRLELGSATSSGIDVNNTKVTFHFLDNPAADKNDGVIEYKSGFDPGLTTTEQHITGVAWGDTFIFDGANFTGDTVEHVGKTLTVTKGGGTILTMDNVTTAGTTTFVASGDEIVAVCYARGTMVATPSGERPVETLRAGKQVITLVDGREVAKTVTWLGRRRVDLARHSRPETVAPVRIRRDALADGIPHRDLVVSPDHAIFVDGKLICARQLVNGTTIRQELDWTAVDYYHVKLEEHAILLAEGLPAESYIDTGNSGFFENSGAPLVLHPDLTDETGYPTREAGSCVPFVWDEANVRPVWQRLADRAADIGGPVPQRATTTEPNLRLRGKYGERSQGKPIYADSNLVIFVLPRGAERVRLLSRAQSPTEARPWLDDRRTLGVRVKRIVLRGANEQREIPMDHPSLTKGWWDIERDGQVMSRWTDGNAVVPLPKMAGHAMLEIHLAGEMLYAVEAEPENQAERHAA